MKKKVTAKAPPTHRGFGATTAAVLVMALGGGMVGPDDARPEADVNTSWLESSPALSDEPAEIRDWWTVFDDDVLTALVHDAYEQNLTLRAAGLRVIQARAARGIAVGEFFPQEQAISAEYFTAELSENNQNNPPFRDGFETVGFSFDAAWLSESHMGNPGSFASVVTQCG